MQFKTELVEDALIIAPPNTDLDAGNADEFKKDIASIIEGQKKVVLDLQPVPFMDSAGMGAMLSVYKKVRSEGGEFRIFGLNKEVKALFELVRMHRLFDIYEDRETTLESLG